MATRDGIPFPLRCRLEHLPQPMPEYHFAIDGGRRWRFDWAWPRQRVALEVDGGVYTRGRHVRVRGYLADIAKLNEAQLLGWIVLRCVPADLTMAPLYALLRRAFHARAMLWAPSSNP